MNEEIVRSWYVPAGVRCVYLYLGRSYEGGGFADEMWSKHTHDEIGAWRKMVIVEFPDRGGTYGYWEDQLRRATPEEMDAAHEAAASAHYEATAPADAAEEANHDR